MSDYIFVLSRSTEQGSLISTSFKTLNWHVYAYGPIIAWNTEMFTGNDEMMLHLL